MNRRHVGDRVLRLLEPLCLLAVPCVLLLCALLRVDNAALLTLVAVAGSLLPFFIRFERQRPRARELLPVAVLGGLAAVGRVLFAAFPYVKPVSAIVIITGVCFGRQSGFLTGALAALASNLFFGQGPWTPWQMYAWGLVGYLAPSVLRGVGRFRFPVGACVYGFLSALLYGFVLDSWYIVGFLSPVTLPGAVGGYLAGLPFSLVHGAATAAFLALLYRPWCQKLRRIQSKYALMDAP